MPEPSAEGKLRKRLKPLDNAGLESGELLIHEIYASIQGESTRAGRPCTFVRTTACHLRCTYCDTPHAFGQGTRMHRDAVAAQVQELGMPLVEITGGEPLLQREVGPLMRELCDAGFEVMLETSGALSIAELDPRIICIMDLKTPSSGEVEANLWENLDHLKPSDEVKFVVGSREDFEWATRVLREQRLHERCTVLMGPVFGAVPPADLVDWILAEKLPVRFQLQLHKFIWDPNARGV